MTRKQAINEYLDALYPHIGLDSDFVALRSGFCDFIDYLQKSDRITEKHASAWDGLKPIEIVKYINSNRRQ